MYTNELFHFLVEEVLPIVGSFFVPLGISYLVHAAAHFLSVMNDLWRTERGGK